MKHKVPLEILEFLQPNKNKNLHLVEAVNTTAILTLKPKNPSYSDFYFEIVKAVVTKETTSYEVHIKPFSRGSTDTDIRTVPKILLEKKLMDWLSRLQEYDNIQTILDDPILKKYQQDFEEKLKILDEDADYAPFDLEKQIALLEYLDVIIEKSVHEKNEDNKQDIETIVQESKALKTEINKISKKQSIERLAKILGRVQKASIKLIQEVFVKTAAEIASKLIIGNG